MQPESVRSVAQRLENYFEWYFRIDPDASAWAVTVVSRFQKLVRGTGDAAEAKKLLDESASFSFGSPWEEMRLALLTLATR
jgi:hypothetical protein